MCLDSLCCYLSIHTLNSLYASCVPDACGPMMGAKRAHCVHFVCANKKKEKWNSESEEKTEDWRRNEKEEKLNELMLIIDKLHTAKVIQHCVLRQKKKNWMHIQLDSGLCCPLVVQPHWAFVTRTRARANERVSACRSYTYVYELFIGTGILLLCSQLFRSWMTMVAS